MFSSVMFRSVMLVQLSPCRNDSLSPLLRFYRECRHRSRGTTVNAVPIPAITAVSVIKFNPITAVALYSGLRRSVYALVTSIWAVISRSKGQRPQSLIKLMTEMCYILTDGWGSYQPPVGWLCPRFCLCVVKFYNQDTRTSKTNLYMICARFITGTLRLTF